MGLFEKKVWHRTAPRPATHAIMMTRVTGRGCGPLPDLKLTHCRRVHRVHRVCAKRPVRVAFAKIHVSVVAWPVSKETGRMLTPTDPLPPPLRARPRALRWRPETFLVLACVLLPFCLFAWDAIETRASVIARGKQNIETTAAALEQHAHATLESYQLVLDLLNVHVRNLGWAELEGSSTLRDVLDGLVRDHHQIGALTLIDADGTIRVSTFFAPTPRPEIRNRDYFKILSARDDGIVIGERVASRLANGDVLNIARRIGTEDGSFRGILVLSTRPSQAFLDFWEKAIPPGAIAALLRGDGMFLARLPRPASDLKQARAPTLGLPEAAGEAKFFQGRSPLDSVERLFMLRKIGGFPAIIVHGNTMAAILEPWYDWLRTEAFVFAAAALGLVTLAWTVARHARRTRGLVDNLAAEVDRRGKAEAELEEVLLDVVDRQEADRRRIAQDLHDSLGQHVALLHLNASLIARAPHDVDRVRAGMEEQRAMAAEISQEISRLAWELRPVWLDGLGLETALRTLANVTASRGGLDVRLDINLGGRRFGESIEAAVYRAVQETATNALKHARASQLYINLEVLDGTLRAIIEDDGAGFPAHVSSKGASPPSPSGGLGLRGIRERLALVGGSLQIESMPGEGTAVTFAIPV